MLFRSSWRTPNGVLLWAVVAVFEVSILLNLYWGRIPAAQARPQLLLLVAIMGLAGLVMTCERLALLAVLPVVLLSGSIARLTPFPFPPLPLFFSSCFLLGLAIKRVIESATPSVRSPEAGSELQGPLTSPRDRPRWSDLLGVFAALVLTSAAITLLLYHNFYPLSGQPYFDYVINRPGDRASQVTPDVLISSANLFNVCLLLLTLIRWGKTLSARWLASLLLGAITIAGLCAAAQSHWQLNVLNAGGVWPSTGRLNGSFEDPNALGWTLIPLLPIALVGLLEARAWLRLLSLAAAAAIAYQLHVSASRTALACAGLTACLLGMSAVICAWRRRKRWLALILVVLAAGIPTAFVIAVRTGPDILLFNRARPMIDLMLERGARSSNMQGLKEVASNRDLWWPSGWRMFREHPFDGVGIGVFPYETVNDGAPFDSAGNGYLQLAAELGIWGLLGGLGAATWALFVSGRRWWAAVGRERRDTAVWSVGVAVSVVCCVIAQFFGSLLTFHQFSVTIVFVLALLLSLKHEAEGEHRTAPSGIVNVFRPSRVMMAGLVAVFAVLNLLGNWPTDPLVFRSSLLGREQNLIAGYREEKFGGDFPFVWTKRIGYGRIRLDGRQRVLRIHAAHPDIAQHPLRVRFSADDGLLADVELRDSEWRQITLHYSGQQDPSCLRVRVQVDRTWRPCDWGVSADNRDLGVAIAGLD